MGGLEILYFPILSLVLKSLFFERKIAFWFWNVGGNIDYISNQIRYPFGVQGCKDLCQPPFSALPLRPVILWVIGDEKVSLQTACFISLRFYQLASDGHELLIICDNPASDIIIDFSFYKSINIAPIKYDFARNSAKCLLFIALFPSAAGSYGR